MERSKEFDVRRNPLNLVTISGPTREFQCLSQQVTTQNLLLTLWRSSPSLLLKISALHLREYRFNWCIIPLLLVQASHWLDILRVHTKSVTFPGMACGPSGGLAMTDLLARIKAKASRRIICSSISNSGELFAYSDHVRPSLFELKMFGAGKSTTVSKRQLPQRLPFAHSMIFSFDSSRLMIAGHDRRIYVRFLLL